MKKEKDDFRDVAAGRAVLSGICAYGGDSFVDVDDLLDANIFSSSADEFDAIIYKCMQNHFHENLDKKLDIPSIISSSKELGLDSIINTPEGFRHLRALFN